ncbi:MAG: DegT/DnrJ/EryC1/StrS family aminotransferase [Chloroflexi bacterium]|nr:DegT/DnrJ/EryC1/StrS family aminotransferase [Chloroflexota bacterium]
MSKLAINGGEKTCNIEWPTWPIWDDHERQGLLAVLESGQWWYGERVKEFEEAFAAFQNAMYGVTATSGTTALETALTALGVGSGDEVIVPPYTFVATASAVLRVGAIPIFADIQPHTLCIDPDDVARKITPQTKAIIPVHLAGYVADMDRLCEIAQANHLALIEDACHSWGSQWKGKGAGAIGTCGVFSFQASKNITSAEGGIILTDTEQVADDCRSYTNVGRRKGGAWYQHFNAGSNLRLTEFQAALLLAQLSRLEAHTLKRQANAALITDGLRGIPGIIPLENDPRMTRRGYHLYTVRLDLDALGITRERFVEALTAEGVPASSGYTIPLYKNPLFERISTDPTRRPYLGDRIDYRQVHCPVCEQVCADTFWLSHTLLLADESAMHQIVAAVRKVCDNVSELRSA